MSLFTTTPSEMGKEIATRFRSFIEDELTQLEQRAESIKKLIKEHEHDIAELNMNLSTVKSAKSECESECKDIEEQIRRKKSEITGVDFIEEAVTSYSSGRKKRKETATPPITPMSTPNKKRAVTAAAAEPVGTTGKNSNNKKRESEANSNTPVKTFSRDNLGRFGKKESSGDGAKNTVNKDANKDKQKNKNQTSKKDDTSDSTSESEDDISSSDEESDDSDDDYEDGNKAKRNKKNATEGKTSKSKGGRGKKK